ncbi:unnamed protein product [Nippostrongylus brasiliensis]|uniref:Uncharacterized protein n=1 Tax=Nippostrongylus brasiliensis TaxID=27835 RepID=A0A0N4YF68_NIPBR|nr:unnamed protein product [Nippostrongylus brasiliensis]
MTAQVRAISPAERRALIPLPLRKKLCQLPGISAACDFNEVPKPQSEDEDYSKWSLCKHHPELMYCKWRGGAIQSEHETPRPHLKKSEKNSEEFPGPESNVDFSRAVEESAFLGSNAFKEPSETHESEPFEVIGLEDMFDAKTEPPVAPQAKRERKGQFVAVIGRSETKQPLPPVQWPEKASIVRTICGRKNIARSKHNVIDKMRNVQKDGKDA